MGISFGGSLATSAAAQPDVAQAVKLIICVSGYNNLDTIGHYYIHDPVYGPTGILYPGHGPPAGPLLFISQYLGEMVKPADVQAFAAPLEYFKKHAGEEFPKEALAKFLAPMYPEQRKTFLDMQSVQSPEMRARYLGVLARHKAEISFMSPASVLGTMKTPLYVIHGSNDPELPASEVDWMRVESRNNPNAHFLVTSWLSHAYIVSSSSLVDKVKTGLFFNQALSRALKREALGA